MKWPSDTRESQKQHAHRHIASIEFAIAYCKKFRTAIQAGGNVGLWPMRLAKSFRKVITFEPEPITLKCLLANAIEKNIEVRSEALGAESGYCSIERRSLGSHRVTKGNDVRIVTVDSLQLSDVDFIQLDIEGYELEAIKGAQKTIRISQPIIQLEMRDLTKEYNGSDRELVWLLHSFGYKIVGDQPGGDVIFSHD